MKLKVKQNGTWVQIADSAFGYKAGAGISIDSNNTISFQNPITAGNGIKVSGNRIEINSNGTINSDVLYGFVEGSGTQVTANYGHAEGASTIASGAGAHAEGCFNTAKGDYSHAEGCFNTAKGDYSHAEGFQNKTEGNYSHAEGQSTLAYGDKSHAEGGETSAVGTHSHAEGYKTTTFIPVLMETETYEAVEGNKYYSFSGSTANLNDIYNLEKYTEITELTDGQSLNGYYYLSSGGHTEGQHSHTGSESAHAEGCYTEAIGRCSHAEGYYTIANDYQLVQGRFNTEQSGAFSNLSSYSSFIIGNGVNEINRSNAFRVGNDGTIYAGQTTVQNGADYAEYFEWLDGNPDNEDRRGRFVTLDGTKIKYAESANDYILGVISGNYGVIGNSASEEWQDKYLTDIYGTRLYETVTIPADIDEETGEIRREECECEQWKVNPNYDPDTPYIPRSQRKEWAPVGMMGQIVVEDDGGCQVNGYCVPSTNGTATQASAGYRVMKRIDATHILALIK